MSIGIPGTVGLLNVGEGDIRLSFDPNDPAERIRAARIVKDLIRRGYALLVETELGSGTYRRATAFDEERCEYLIADFDPEVAHAEDAKELANVAQQDAQEQGTEVQAQPAAPHPRGRPKTKRVDAGKTAAVAVPRISGG